MVKKALVADTSWGDFKMVSSEVPFRLIYRSYGPEKVGKNHFGLTGPGPIAIQSFDIGLEGVVEKFRKLGKEVRSTRYEFEKGDATQEAAIEIRDRFIADYKIALKMARTIQWDTETELWEVFRYAKFGVMSDAPKNYVELNGEYRDLIQMAYAANVNLQLIQKVKEKWGTIKKQNREGRTVDSPYPTGEMEPTGFKEAGYIVQASLKHSWSKPVTDDDGVTTGGFKVEVLNCRQQMAIAGVTYSNIDMPTLGQLIFEDSTEEDWA